MPSPSIADTGAAPFMREGRPLATARDVADYLDTDYGRMLWTLYKAPEDARYRHFEIPKRTGGMRPIHAPIGLVRDLQTRLKGELDKLYAAHPNAHGFIAARSVVTNAAGHAGRRWVLNVDLEDFFPSVNFGRVRGLLMRPPFDLAPAAATVIAQIVTHRNGLPQGAPTSPVLSNFIATALDRGLLRLARRHHVTYSRYADDITFSCSEPVFPPALAVRAEVAPGAFRTEAGEALVAAVAVGGFRINDRKVRLQGHGVRQSVTGITVNARTNVGRERVRRLRAMLHAWEHYGLPAAADEHMRKYSRRNRRHERDSKSESAERAFRNVVYGNLSFIKMVRGPADPIFLKLCAKLLDLDPNPSRFLRQMVFGASDYDVFISHAGEDKEDIARPIYAACQRLGIKAFLDEEHIGWGENFTRKINTALGAARTILVVVSGHSVSKDWPMAEINMALAFEIEGKKRVLALVVGKPDLTRLPLVKTKSYMQWTGDGEAVAKRLRALVQADRRSAGTVAVAAAPPAPGATRSPWAPPLDDHSGLDAARGDADAKSAPRRDGWMRRLLRGFRE